MTDLSNFTVCTVRAYGCLYFLVHRLLMLQGEQQKLDAKYFVFFICVKKYGQAKNSSQEIIFHVKLETVE